MGWLHMISYCTRITLMQFLKVRLEGVCKRVLRNEEKKAGGNARRKESDQCC